MNIHSSNYKNDFRSSITKLTLRSAIASALTLATSSNVLAVLDETTILSINGAGASFFTMGGGTVVNAPGFDGQNISGNQGLILGTTQLASGSHSGAIDGSENPTVDNPWLFFNNTGMHGTANNSSVLSASGNTGTVDLSGWRVAWNGVEGPAINMGSGAWNGNSEGVAQVTCAVDCSDGDTYILTYSATVPDDGTTNFGNTQYLLHLEGTITDTNDAPVATGAPANLTVNGSTTVDTTTLVTDPQGSGTIDFTSVEFQNNTCTSTMTNNSNGIITISDSGTAETCSIEYRVSDNEGMPSNWATISVTIAVNPPPAANPDTANTQINTAVDIDVLINDTDDGAIDMTTVIATQGSNGSTVVNGSTGVVTYTPNNDFAGEDTFTYTVDDTDAPPATSGPGTVTVNVNAPPTAVDDGPTTTRNTPVVIDVLANDSDSFGGSIDPATVSASNGSNGTTSVNPTTGEITYTPANNYVGTDTFTYTVDDDFILSATSNTATVTVTVNNNPPIAVNENASINTNINANIVINVASNDSDDISLNLASIVITSNPVNGTAIANTDGTVTYTPNTGFIGTDPFSYTIDDNESPAPATSNEASVTISVSADIVPIPDFLIFNTGTIANGPYLNLPQDGNGSWFTMLINPGEFSVTTLTGFNHIQLGIEQPAFAGSTVEPNIDDPWPFFGQLGVHQTTKPITVLTNDGAGNVTLDFSGWNVSWNGVASIPMSSGADSGIATMNCAANCDIGDTFILNYRATVPQDSGTDFSGVKYSVHLEGVISDQPPAIGCSPNAAYTDNIIMAETQCDPGSMQAGTPLTITAGNTAISIGNTTGTGLTAQDTGVSDPRLNPNDGKQCVGGCLDIVIPDVPVGGFATIVFKLTEPLPEGARYRVLINGVWNDLDGSEGDLVGSADANNQGQCQLPSGRFNIGLREGAECVVLLIKDGGPNDVDGTANGAIVDPSGVLLPGSPNVPTSTTDGCSMSGNTVNLMQRADWLLLLGFITWLGLVIRKKQG